MVTGKAPAGAIVTLEPADARELPVATQPAAMDQFDRQFHPELLVVHAGRPVRFSNSENELHNVRVLLEEDATKARTTVYYTNLDPSTLKTHTFDEPGFYEVRCDLHQSMQAFIFVAPTPYALVVGEDGTFMFPAVEPGAYRVTVLNEGRKSVRTADVVGPRTEL